MRLTTYESAVILYLGPHGCSVMAAPPTTSRRSSTTTRRPRLASRPAVTRPLCPAPMTMTSYRWLIAAEGDTGPAAGPARALATTRRAAWARIRVRRAPRDATRSEPVGEESLQVTVW